MPFFRSKDTKISQKALSLDELEKIFGDAPIGVVAVDLKGRIIFANKDVLKNTGLQEKDIVGKPFQELAILNIKDKSQLLKIFANAIQGVKEKTFELSWKHSDGSLHFGEVNYSILKKGINIKYILGMIKDITDRKALEDYLYDDIDKFKTISDLSGEGIVIHDGSRIIDANDLALELFKTNKNNLIGRNIYDFVAKSSMEKVRDNINRHFSGSYEARIKNDEGKQFDCFLESREVYNNWTRQRIVIFKEILKNKETDRDFLRQLEKANTYLDVASVILLALDRSGKIELINEKGCELLGFKDKYEALGRKWFDEFVPKNKRKEVKKGFRDLLSGKIKEHRVREDSVLMPDGNIKIIRWTNKIIKDRSGKIVGTLSSGEDITENIQKEKELKENERKYRELVDNIYEGIWQIDKNGVNVFINKQMAAMLGYDVDDMIGKPFFDFMDEKQKELASKYFNRRAKGIKEVHKFTFKKKDGNDILTELGTVPTFDENGDFSGGLAYVRDITEEEEIKKTIEIEKARLDTLLLNSPDIVFEIDRKGNILFINKKQLFPQNNSKNKNIFDILERNASSSLRKIIKISEYSGEPKKIIIQRLSENLKGKWFECRINPIVSDSSINTFIVLLTDITERYEAEEELKRSQKDLTLAQEAAQIGSWILDPETKKVIWSRETYKIFGIDARKKAPDFPNGHVPILHPDDIGPLEKWLGEALEKGYGKKFYLRIFTKDSEEKILEVICKAEELENGKKRLIGTAQDVTDLKRAEDALKESEKNYRLLVENQTDFIIKISIDGKYQFVSPSFLDFLGKDKEELIGKDSYSFAYYKDREKTEKEMEKVYKFPYEADIRQRVETVEGIKWVQWGVKAVTEKGKIKEIIANGKDVTENVEYEERLKYLSFHDSLTGLYNRAYFEEEIRRLDTKRKLPLSVIMGDVNSLKLINDTFGHKSGDKLLIEISKILKRFCRSEDIVARWGGDEFSILLPKTSVAVSESISERIGKACEKVKKLDVPLSISLGVASKITEEEEVEKVLRAAEDNMYRQKLTERKSITSSVITSLTRSLWEKSDETEKHSSRLEEYANSLGKKIKLSRSEMDKLRLLCKLHDIGKIALPHKILLKKGKLTKKEWDEIKKHPEIGYSICDSSPMLSHISEEVLSHHEWFNGKGYPQGIKGEKIPILSRLLSIVDAYDVMINGRPYQKAKSKKAAIKEIKKFAGIQFDPDIAESFINILNGN